MEYMALVFQGIGDFLLYMWSLEFVFLGIQTSVGVLVVFSSIVAIILKLLRG